MHFEVPKSKFATVREFFGEYAMIVVSILTALALEFAAEQWHRAHRAAQARANMDAELKANVQAIHAARAFNKTEAKLLRELFDTLSEDILAGKPDAQIIERFKTKADGKFNLLLQVPEPLHDAFDTAVASQAASWIPQDQFMRYSKVYTQQRSLRADITNHRLLLLNGSQMVDVKFGLMLGMVQPKDLLHSLGQMIVQHGVTENKLAVVEQQFSKVFPELAPAQ
jgi:hypothetical protein